MLHFRPVPLVLVFCLGILGLAAGSAQGATANLVANGDFELVQRSRPLPTHWGYQAAPAGAGEHVRFAIDEQVFASGKRSFSAQVDRAGDVALFQTPRFEVEPGRQYRVALKVKLGSGGLDVRQNMHDASGKMVPAHFKVIAQQAGPCDWQTLTTTFRASQDAQQASLTLFFRGPGTAWLDQVVVTESPDTSQETIRLMLTPNGWVDDHVVYLPAGAPIQLFLTPMNPSGYQPQRPRLVVDLPEGVTLLGTDYASQALSETAIQRDGQSYRRYTYTIGLAEIVLHNKDAGSAAWRSIPLVVRAAETAAGVPMRGYCHFQDEGAAGAEYAFTIRVIEPTRHARTPERFRVGANLVTSADLSGEALDAFVSYYKQVGFNTAYLPDLLRPGATVGPAVARDVQPVVEAMKAAGMETWCVTSQIVNGYEIPFAQTSTPIPDEVRITNAKGQVMPNSFDPAYILADGPLYVEALGNALDRPLEKGFDHIWSNWEPWRYRLGRGGNFTPATLRAFARYAGLAEEQVLSQTPQQLIESHHDQLQDFYSHQHAEVIRNLVARTRAAAAARGRSMMLDFCLGSEFFESLNPAEGATPSDYALSFRSDRFMGDIDAVSGWYYLTMFGRKYEAERVLYDSGLRHHELAEGSLGYSYASLIPMIESRQAYLGAFETEAEPLPYVHLIQGNQGNDWVVRAEELSLQLLAAFVAGADGAQVYYFPRGYDGRYWNAIADAIDRIAFFERWVLEGRKDDTLAQVRAINAAFQHEALSDHLAYRAFELDGRTLVAVGNFNLVWPAYVHITARGEAAEGWLVYEPYEQRAFGVKGRTAVDSSALQAAVFRIPPGAFRFFVIEPHPPSSLEADTTDLVAMTQMHERELAPHRAAFERWLARFGDHLSRQ